jgi:hypothetical protein
MTPEAAPILLLFFVVVGGACCCLLLTSSLFAVSDSETPQRTLLRTGDDDWRVAMDKGWPRQGEQLLSQPDGAQINLHALSRNGTEAGAKGKLTNCRQTVSFFLFLPKIET